MGEELLVSLRGSILEVALNRPDKLNAITPDMMRQLRQTLLDFRDDDKMRVLMLTASGKFYSAGMDIAAGLAPQTDSGIAFRRWYQEDIHATFDLIESIEKPIIASIQGPCLGGALEMALSCDFRLCAESAKFALPETNLGALPGSGGVSRLTQLVGKAEAKWMVMAAKEVSAERALRTGLVHEIFADHEFEAKSHEFAKSLSELPYEVLGSAKIAISLVSELGAASARHVERLANTPLAQSQEHRTLVESFLNRKR